jgi:hypothetical protein
MSEPVVFEPVVQKSTNDCAVACLAMYLGLPYSQVREAAGRRLTKEGMTTRAIINTAKKLGAELVLQKDFDADDVGIADLLREDDSDGHVVLFVRGAVWTTASGQIWADLFTYCKVHKFKLLGLITRTPQEGGK